MVKKGYHGNQSFGLVRDRIKVCQMYLFTTTDIWHKMSMVLHTKKPNFWLSIEVVVLYLLHYDHLLQNAAVLIQNPTFITKCDNFVTKCDVYYKMRRCKEVFHPRSGFRILPIFYDRTFCEKS